MEPTEILIRRATAIDNVLLAALGSRTFEDTFAEANTPEDMAAYVSLNFNVDKLAAELAEDSTRFLSLRSEARRPVTPRCAGKKGQTLSAVTGQSSYRGFTL